MRLSIRPLVATDSDALLALITPLRDSLVASGFTYLPTTASESAAFIGEADSAPGQAKSVYGVFESSPQTRLVGFVGMETLNRFSGVGVWYAMAPDHRRRGQAKTAVMTAMADFAERLVAAGHPVQQQYVVHTLRSNAKSSGLAISIGFEREVMIDYTRSTSSRGGRRFEGYAMSCTAVDLRNQLDARLMQQAMQAGMKSARSEAVRTRAVRAMR